MALRHRQNPNQRPRIVLFVGSPLHHGRIDDDGDKDFGINEQLLRTLKKNHVSLNVVSLGTESVETNRPLLQHLVDYLNAEAPKADPSDNSTGSDSGHVKSSSLLEVPPGACLLEVCRRRPELTGSAGENVSSDYHPHDGSNGGGMDVDEDLDPELVLALKLSLEEEQQRQARLHQQQPEQSEASDLNHGSKNAGNYEGDGDRKNASNNEEGEMDDELQQAIALSLQQNADQKKH
jgi:26S proteasome regulatory subunit N10